MTTARWTIRRNQHPSRRLRRLISAVSALILSLGIGVVGAAPATATPTSDPCKFMVFIGVRGTDATGGVGTGIHSGRIWTQGGKGSQISYLAGLFDSSDMPIWFGALRYPASGGTGYAQSVAKGRDTLVTELNYIANLCSTLPATVLAGHSQGADVVLEALTVRSGRPNLSTRAKAMITAAAVFGDPSYRPNEAYNAPGSPTVRYGMFGRSVASVGNIASHKFWGYPMGGTGPGWVYKVRSYCKLRDAFCQNAIGDPDAMTIHNSYTTMMPAARDWINYLVSGMAG